MVSPRVATGLVLVPLLVVAVLTLPHGAISGLFAVACLMGAWEWAALTGVQDRGPRLGYLGVVAAAMIGLWLAGPAAMTGVIAAAVAGWIAALVWLWNSRDRLPSKQPGVWAKLGMGVVVLVPAWAALSALHALSPLLMLFVLVLIWCADTAAYYSGRTFGRRRLAPAISPGKTRAGLYAELLAAVAIGVLGAAYWAGGAAAAIAFTALCAATIVFSVGGDLLESVLKRWADAKDSGTLLPGHGGLLDRIDSLTAAAPAFAFGYQWLKLTI